MAEDYGLDHQAIKRALNYKTQHITQRYIKTRAEKMRHIFEAIAEQIQWWAFENPPPSKMSKEEIEIIEKAMKPDENVDDLNKGQPKKVVTTSTAREMAAFDWAFAQQVEPASAA